MSDEARERLVVHEDRALLVALVACSLALAYALDAPGLLAAAIVAAGAFFVVRKLGLEMPALGEGGVVLVAALVALPLGLSQDDSTLALAVFLFAAMATKTVAPRSDRDRATAAAVGVVLAGTAASEAVEPLFGLLFLASLLSVMAWAVLRARRQRNATDLAVERKTVPSLVRRDSAETDREVLAGLDGAYARGQDLQAPGPSRNRLWVGRVGWRRAGVVWTGVMVSVLVGSGLFFFAFPRMGAKLLSNQQKTSTQRLSGFSDRVGLDDIGKIKKNNAVAFRVETGPSHDPFGGEPYWRGRALDRYSGKSWVVSGYFHQARKLSHEGQLGFKDRLVAGPQHQKRKAVFYLEPLGTRCLFTTGRVKNLKFKTARPVMLGRDAMGSIFMDRAYPTPMAYEVETYPEEASRYVMPAGQRRRVARICLRMPRSVDRRRLRAYGQRVLRESNIPTNAPPEKKAAVLAEYLSRTNRYTLDAGRQPKNEPVGEFLFVRKEGHCELFASSHVMILRSLGIPARLVTGFRGGEFNEWSGTWTVRQSNAHAWTEVLTTRGWRRFDPTPAEEPTEPSMDLFETMSRLTEWLELRWFAWVIAFDAYDQQNALRSFREWLSQQGLGDGPSRSDRSNLVLGLMAGLVLVLGAVAAVILRRNRVRGPPGPTTWARGAQHPSALVLDRLLLALSRRGYARQVGETPLELVRRAEPLLSLQSSLTGWMVEYYADRFGARPLSAAELQRLEGLVRELDQPGSG